MLPQTKPEDNVPKTSGALKLTLGAIILITFLVLFGALALEVRRIHRRCVEWCH